MSSQSVYDDLAAAQLELPDVTLGRSLGNDVLMVKGKIFAFRKDERLVVKLPEERVSALISGGAGVPFRTGQRTMREWVALDRPSRGAAAAWRAYADEARAFVTR